MEELVTLPTGEHTKEEYSGVLNVKHPIGLFNEEEGLLLEENINSLYTLEIGDEDKVSGIVEKIQELISGKDISFSMSDLTIYTAMIKRLNNTTKETILNSLKYLKSVDQLIISNEVEGLFDNEENFITIFVYKPNENQSFPFGALDGYLEELNSFRVIVHDINNDEYKVFCCYLQDLGSDEEVEHFKNIYEISDKEQYA